jgi:dTDP-4-dehydrorhamnose reductase
MKIILLGAGGQLGTEWYRFLENTGSSVEYTAYSSKELDITKAEDLGGAIQRNKADLVINCAAYTKVDLAEEEPDRARLINATAVGTLANICSEYNVKLIHYSTDYVFPGREQDRNRFPEGYPEDHPVDPINRYGQTKWEGEQAIRMSGCRHLIIRVSWLCGRYVSNFVKTMLRLAGERSAVDIVNDQWGSPTFTDNVVANTWKLIEEEAEGTYHLTSDGLITWADFAEAIFRLSGKPVQVNRISSEAFPVQAKRPAFSKLDITKVRSVPCTDLEDWMAGLERLIQKLKNR